MTNANNELEIIKQSSLYAKLKYTNPLQCLDK